MIQMKGGSMTVQSVLVTGGSGFVGSHLLVALAKAFPAADIHATRRCPQAPMLQGVSWHTLDICDAAAVQLLVQSVAPDVVIHLAAQANVPFSFQNPNLTWQVNLDGARNLFTALERYMPNSLLIQVGSADMYGKSFKHTTPVDETALLQPLNPYAASKAAADLAAFQLSQTSSVKVIRARPFNHIGAGQLDTFVASSFARQIVAVEQGRQESLKVGDLSAERDFMHVSDAVAAYVELIRHHDQFYSGAAVNICSGTSVSIADMLDTLRALAKVDVPVLQDPDRMRKSDIEKVCGSHAFLSECTGWKPRASLNDALLDVLEYWRHQSG